MAVFPLIFRFCAITMFFLLHPWAPKTGQDLGVDTWFYSRYRRYRWRGYSTPLSTVKSCYSEWYVFLFFCYISCKFHGCIWLACVTWHRMRCSPIIFFSFSYLWNGWNAFHDVGWDVPPWISYKLFVEFMPWNRDFLVLLSCYVLLHNHQQPINIHCNPSQLKLHRSPTNLVQLLLHSNTSPPQTFKGLNLQR